VISLNRVHQLINFLLDSLCSLFYLRLLPILRTGLRLLHVPVILELFSYCFDCSLTNAAIELAAALTSRSRHLNSRWRCSSCRCALVILRRFLRFSPLESSDSAGSSSSSSASFSGSRLERGTANGISESMSATLKTLGCFAKLKRTEIYEMFGILAR